MATPEKAVNSKPSAVQQQAAVRENKEKLSQDEIAKTEQAIFNPGQSAEVIEGDGIILNAHDPRLAAALADALKLKDEDFEPEAKDFWQPQAGDATTLIGVFAGLTKEGRFNYAHFITAHPKTQKPHGMRCIANRVLKGKLQKGIPGSAVRVAYLGKKQPNVAGMTAEELAKAGAYGDWDVRWGNK